MVFRCEPCNKEFQSAEALNSHNADKHAPSSHEAKELKRRLVEEQRAKEAAGARKGKWKKTLLTYAGLLVIFLVIVGGATFLLKDSPGSQPAIGPVGSTHTHQDWKFYAEGEALNFDGVRYQVRIQQTHVEGGEGDLIHVHATGVTFGYFLESMGFRLNSTCVKLDDGRELCNTADKTVKFYVNGEPSNEWGGYVLQDLDKVLLSYGNETEEQLQAQLESIPDRAKSESRTPGMPTHGQQ